MDREEHREQVVSAMEAVMRKDRTKSFVVGWTKLGLLEMTRKKPGKALRSHLPSLAALAGAEVLLSNNDVDGEHGL